MPTPVEQIKERLNIVDVAGMYLKLDKAGVNFKARCPFHNEKTASLFISPARQSFHCFGCHKGGDLISFVQEIEGLDFPGTLKLLADRAGIQLESLDRHGTAEDLKKAETRAVLEAAAAFYEDRLTKEGAVKKYLLERGLTEETIKNFRLGFAPDGWQELHNHLVSLDYGENEMKAAGLVAESAEKKGRVYDRFRSRIMFPLLDSVGGVVGFSGRIFDPAGQKVNEAKYVNSPQTIFYDKSKILYGYDKAKVEIRRRDFVILVEGQMDLVMCHQVGLINTVAVSGTALTDNHLTTLKRLSGNIVMAFDADGAGLSASRRALELALGQGFEVKIAALPEGKDPADVAVIDPQSLLEVVKDSVHVIDFYLGAIIRREPDRRARAHAARLELYPLIGRLVHVIDQAHFIKKIADGTGLAEDIIWQDIKDTVKTPLPGPTSVRREEKPAAEVVRRRDKIFDHLMGMIFILEEAKSPATIEALASVEDIAGSVYVNARRERLELRRSEVMLESEILYGSDEKQLKDALAELVVNFRAEFLKEELMRAMEKLKEAEAMGDAALVDKYLKKCQDISNSINQRT